jgi:RHS repeat-associated protein
VLEQRTGTSTSADLQYVWGLRYVDDLVLRDRNADANPLTGSDGLPGSGLEERLYALQDPNWNVTAIAFADGAIAERYRYTAYGAPAILDASYNAAPGGYDWKYLFTGREFDAETGLYNYRMRYYTTQLGRFTERDPIGYGGGSSLYAYTNGKPLTSTDPFGTDTEVALPSGVAASIARSIEAAGNDPAALATAVRDAIALVATLTGITLTEAEVLERWRKGKRKTGRCTCVVERTDRKGKKCNVYEPIQGQQTLAGCRKECRKWYDGKGLKKVIWNDQWYDP